MNWVVLTPEMSATDPMNQYKIKGFGNMSYAAEGYNARSEAVRKVSILEARLGTCIAALTY